MRELFFYLLKIVGPMGRGSNDFEFSFGIEFKCFLLTNNETYVIIASRYLKIKYFIKMVNFVDVEDDYVMFSVKGF
jgi:hypothetical protein